MTCSIRPPLLLYITASFRKVSAHLEVDGSATLANGSFTENLPFQVQAAIRNADVAELQRAAGLNYPVTGTLNFTVQAAGTEGNPHGSGHFSLTGGASLRPPGQVTHSESGVC